MRELAAEIAALAAPVVLVHGGGAEVSEWCARLGHRAALRRRAARHRRRRRSRSRPRCSPGSRTSGWSRCCATRGVDAVGLSARSTAASREVEPHPDAARLGEVGAVAAVDTALLEHAARRGAHAGAGEHRRAPGRAAQRQRRRSRGGARRPRSVREALVLLSDTPGLVLGGAIVARARSRGRSTRALAQPGGPGRHAAEARAPARPRSRAARARVIAAWSGPGTLARARRRAPGPEHVRRARRPRRQAVAWRHPGGPVVLDAPTSRRPRTPWRSRPRRSRCFAPLYPLPRLELVSGTRRTRDGRGRARVPRLRERHRGQRARPRADRASRARSRSQMKHARPRARTCSPTRPAIELARSCSQATGYDRVFFCNSGTEGDRGGAQVRARARAAPRARRAATSLAFQRRLPRPHRLRALGDVDAALPRAVRAADPGHPLRRLQRRRRRSTRVLDEHVVRRDRRAGAGRGRRGARDARVPARARARAARRWARR